MIPPRCYRFVLRRAWLMLVIGLLSLPSASQAQDAPSCDNALARADTLYRNDLLFAEASTLLESCMQQDAFTAEEEKLAAYKLLVQIYESAGLEQELNNTLARLFELVPNYAVEPSDPPTVRQLIEAYRRERAREAEASAEAAPLEEEQAAIQDAEPIFTPSLPETETEVEEEPAARRSGWRRWMLLGGGAVLAGTATLLLTGGGGTPRTLPTAGIPLPPGRPSGN